jgi:predicted Zn-dependent protease
MRIRASASFDDIAKYNEFGWIDYMGKINKQKLAALFVAALTILGLILWRTSTSIPSEIEYRQRAQQLASTQNWRALEELTKHWASHHQNSEMMHAARADALRMQGNFAGAAEEYRKAIELENNNPQLHAYLGITLLETGNFPGARDSCQRSVSIFRQQADGWYCLALASAELDDVTATNSALAELAQLRMEQYQTAGRVIRDHVCGRKKNIAGTELCR